MATRNNFLKINFQKKNADKRKVMTKSNVKMLRMVYKLVFKTNSKIKIFRFVMSSDWKMEKVFLNPQTGKKSENYSRKK